MTDSPDAISVLDRKKKIAKKKNNTKEKRGKNQKSKNKLFSKNECYSLHSINHIEKYCIDIMKSRLTLMPHRACVCSPILQVVATPPYNIGQYVLKAKVRLHC